MSLTVQEYAANIAEKQAEKLLAAANAVPQDKWNWKPLDRGRSVVSQLAECAVINGGLPSILRDRGWTGSTEDFQAAMAAFDTPEKVSAALLESTQLMAAAIRAVPDDQLAIDVVMPWATFTMAELLLLPYWNMSYHEGQITSIETLCG